ncbi:hypothetical protein WMZ97_07580 [Lentibacillus sp. N15]
MKKDKWSYGIQEATMWMVKNRLLWQAEATIPLWQRENQCILIMKNSEKYLKGSTRQAVYLEELTDLGTAVTVA